LTTMLSEHVTMEIDLEILDMLIVAADTTEYWSANPGVEYNANTGALRLTHNTTSLTKQLGTKLLVLNYKKYQIKSMRKQ